MFTMFRRKTLALFAALVMLAGCQEVLYSELTEADANEMVAMLVLSGIEAERQKEQGAAYSVMVKKEDLAVAVTVLKNAGLPREQFSSLGDVFGDTGVVGTPFEERIRYTYATNEELSHTISQIKGIDRARVHVVIPPEERFGKKGEPARASVAVFHDASFDRTLYSAQIKTLVAFAVPGLEVDRVSISFFATPGFVVQPNATAPSLPGTAEAGLVPGTQLFPVGWELPIMGFVLLLVSIIIVRMLYAVLRWIRPRSRKHA